MLLHALKAKIKEFAKKLELDAYDLADLEKITSANELIGGMSLLYRVLTHVTKNAVFELRRSLIAKFGFTANELPYYFYDLKSKSLIQMSTLELEANLRRAQQSQSSIGYSRDGVFASSSSHSVSGQPSSNQTIFNP